MDTEETSDLVDTEDEPAAGPLGGPAGVRMGGMLGQAPRGLHGCAAIAAPASPPPRYGTTPASPAKGAKGQRPPPVRTPTPSGPPRAYGSPPEEGKNSGRRGSGDGGGGRTGKKKKGGGLSPAVRGSRDGGEEDGGGRMLRRFRTKVGGWQLAVALTYLPTWRFFCLTLACLAPEIIYGVGRVWSGILVRAAGDSSGQLCT